MLLVEEVDLIPQLVGCVLQPAHFLFQLVALGSDAGQLVTLRVDACLRVLRSLSAQCRCKNQRAHTNQQPATHQTRRKCRPTETSLPRTPISAPRATPKKIISRAKKIVWMKYSLTTLLATQTKRSENRLPNRPSTS